MRNRTIFAKSAMNSAQGKNLFLIALLLFANGCIAKQAEAPPTTKAGTPTSPVKVICSYAPSQSSVVSHLAVTAGGSAIAAASVAQAAGLTAVLHSSGAYIFTSAGGYVAGTIGTAAALPAIVTVGIIAGGTAATLELICASTNYPGMASKVQAAASEFMIRSKGIVADTSGHTVAIAIPFIAESHMIVARVRTDAFKYASRANVQLSAAIQAKAK